MHGLVGLYIETTLSISTHNLQKSYMALALLASATDKLSQKPIASEHAVTQVLPTPWTKRSARPIHRRSCSWEGQPVARTGKRGLHGPRQPGLPARATLQHFE
jgi:hypothetical protein